VIFKSGGRQGDNGGPEWGPPALGGTDGGWRPQAKQLRTERRVYSIHCNDRKQSNTTHEMSGIVHRLAWFTPDERRSAGRRRWGLLYVGTDADLSVASLETVGDRHLL